MARHGKRSQKMFQICFIAIFCHAPYGIDVDINSGPGCRTASCSLHPSCIRVLLPPNPEHERIYKFAKHINR
jgi:hypothetical protein